MTGDLVMRPQGDFSANGRISGTVTLYDASTDEILWETHCPNWSSPKQRGKVLEDIQLNTGAAEDRLLLAYLAMLRTVRNSQAEILQAQEQASNIPRPAPPPHDVPAIPVNGLTTGEQAKRAFSAIQAFNRGDQGPKIFRFGSASMADIIPGSDRNRFEIRTLAKNELMVKLDEVADWVKVDAAQSETPSNPPRSVIDYLLGTTATELPQLNGLAASPYCMADGTIITEKGYNESSALYLAADTTGLPAVSDKPTESEVADATYLLTAELFVDFPFKAQADAANTIAIMLNMLCRPMIDGPTPLFVVEAPAPRTGKSLLAKAIGRYVSGTDPATLPYPSSTEEFDKVVVSALMGGTAMALIDNVNGELNSATLASVLTSTEPAVRVMRTQKLPTFPNRATWVCTANNMRMSEELAGRSVFITLDSGMEDPSSRTDIQHKDIRRWINESRSEALHACFTLVRNWIASGRPRAEIPFGSFESWTQTVGGILAAAGIDGFLENRGEGRARTDDSSAEDRGFVLKWSEVYQADEVDSGKLLKLSKECDMLLDVRQGTTQEKAVMAMGRWLADRRGRVYGGWRINSRKDRLNRNKWMLERMEQRP